MLRAVPVRILPVRGEGGRTFGRSISFHPSITCCVLRTTLLSPCRHAPQTFWNLPNTQSSLDTVNVNHRRVCQ